MIVIKTVVKTGITYVMSMRVKWAIQCVSYSLWDFKVHLSYSMERSPSGEANRFSDSQ